MLQRFKYQFTAERQTLQYTLWLGAQTAWDLWHQLHSRQAAEQMKIQRVNAA